MAKLRGNAQVVYIVLAPKPCPCWFSGCDSGWFEHSEQRSSLLLCLLLVFQGLEALGAFQTGVFWNLPSWDIIWL